MTSQVMPANFLTLPRELRDKIYELCLLRKEPISPGRRFCHNKLAPGLLGVNKTINYEARLVLYRNCFDFTSLYSENVSSFLETVGGNNADCIQHIYIAFPSLCNLEPGKVTLGEYNTRILASIQSRCANLKTITTSRSSSNLMEFTLRTLDNPEVVSEALTLVDTCFRAISSLQNIIVEVYEDGWSDYVRRQIEHHGWTLSLATLLGGWGSDGSLEDDWDRSDAWEYQSNDDDHFNDDYDYEYDSDFWRRAAD